MIVKSFKISSNNLAEERLILLNGFDKCYSNGKEITEIYANGRKVFPCEVKKFYVPILQPARFLRYPVSRSLKSHTGQWYGGVSTYYYKIPEQLYDIFTRSFPEISEKDFENGFKILKRNDASQHFNSSSGLFLLLFRLQELPSMRQYIVGEYGGRWDTEYLEIVEANGKVRPNTQIKVVPANGNTTKLRMYLETKSQYERYVYFLSFGDYRYIESFDDGIKVHKHEYDFHVSKWPSGKELKINCKKLAPFTIKINCKYGTDGENVGIYTTVLEMKIWKETDDPKDNVYLMIEKVSEERYCFHFVSLKSFGLQIPYVSGSYGKMIRGVKYDNRTNWVTERRAVADWMTNAFSTFTICSLDYYINEEDIADKSILRDFTVFNSSEIPSDSDFFMLCCIPNYFESDSGTIVKDKNGNLRII